MKMRTVFDEMVTHLFHKDPIGLVRKRFPNISLEPMVQIKGKIDNLHLGANVMIQYGSVLHLGGMNWCGNEGNITVGDNSVISPYCVIYGCGPGGIRIGNDFDCGPYVGIFSSRTDYLSGPGSHIFEPVIIGNNVIIYGHCIIGPGVRIGNGAVIAAGSVVTGDIPENCFVGGSPAHIIKHHLRHPPDKEDTI
jgi:acetyltransferase-like isoleucine patch superfamily enzyme